MTNNKEKLGKQSAFLNRWAGGYLQKKLGGRRKCLHRILNLMLENRFLVYVRCGDCGRTLKLYKEL